MLSEMGALSFHGFQPKFHDRTNDFPHISVDDSVEQKNTGEPKCQLLSLIGLRRPPRTLRPHNDHRDRSLTPSSGQPARRWRRFGGRSRKISVIHIDPSSTICAVLVRNGVKSTNASPPIDAALRDYDRAIKLSDTFAGIAPAGVTAFILAQVAGMLAAVILSRWLWRELATA